MKKMNHLDYLSELAFIDDRRINSLFVANIRAPLQFSGETLENARATFVETQDDYLDWCATDNWGAAGPSLSNWN